MNLIVIFLELCQGSFKNICLPPSGCAVPLESAGMPFSQTGCYLMLCTGFSEVMSCGLFYDNFLQNPLKFHFPQNNPSPLPKIYKPLNLFDSWIRSVTLELSQYCKSSRTYFDAACCSWHSRPALPTPVCWCVIAAYSGPKSQYRICNGLITESSPCWTS